VPGIKWLIEKRIPEWSVTRGRTPLGFYWFELKDSLLIDDLMVGSHIHLVRVFRDHQYDTALPADQFQVHSLYRPATSDMRALIDALTAQQVLGAVSSDSSGLIDTINGTIAASLIYVSDSTASGETLSALTIYNQLLTDSIATGETLSVLMIFKPALSDTAISGETLTVGWQLRQALTDSASVGETLAALVRFGLSTSDSAAASDTTIPILRFSATQTDSGSTADSISSSIANAYQFADDTDILFADGSTVTHA
jgi:hypothetical protein